MSGQRYNTAQTFVRSPINQEHLIIIFGILVNNRNLFVRVKPLLKPELLNQPGEEFHAAFLRMLTAVHDETGQMPHRHVALAEMIGQARDPYSQFSEHTVQHEIEVIYGFTQGVPPTVLQSTENAALGYIEQILIERRVVAQARNLLLNSTGQALHNPSEVFEAFDRSVKEVRRLTASSIITSVPTIQRRSNNYVPMDHDTDFINALTKGGFQRKTVNGLFGVYGGCKTTVATQTVASRINMEWSKYLRNEKHEIVVFANCEGAPFEISYRVLSFLAKIPQRSVKDHFNDVCPLRDYIPQDPNDYQNKWNIPLTEVQRLDEAIPKIEKFLKIIDFSGSTPGSESMGKSYVDDIEVAVDNYCQDSGLGVSYFVLDYGKAFARRYMAANNIPMDNIRHYLGRLPDAVRRQVADKFDCAALVLQQMNKQALSKQAGTLLSHVDSSEASDFGENCHFCVTLSSPMKDMNDKTIINMNLSKARDVEIPRRMPSLEYIPYCQGLKLTDDFRVRGGSLEHVEARNVEVARPVPRARNRGSAIQQATAQDLNPE
jgi:hypothetical protein